jgi:MGT family glycosyltransferase
MARILAYTSPALGHLFPLAPILLELQRRGHAVALRTLAAGVDRMRGAGLDAAPIDGRIEAIALDDYRAKGPAGSIARSTTVFAERAAHEVGDLRAAIEAERPDAVIVDINTWGAMAAAEAWGGPWAAFCPYPIPLSSPDAPPFGLGLPPARGPLGRLRDAAVRPLVMGAVERATLPKVAALRAGLGLAPFRSLDELQTAAPLLIYLTAEPFEYPRRDWPASYALVGPTHWEPPHAPLPWLDAVERPIVLVTTSSEFQDDGELVRTAFEALADEDVFVLATLPSGDPEGYAVPANARLERFVPHGAVLPRAACAVTHGGMGATQKALAHGVPVCAVPFGRDQFEVARRVEVAGAGTRLPASRLSPGRLRAKVREAIARRPGAEAIARAYRAAGGAVAAADAVEERLVGRTVAPARARAVA